MSETWEAALSVTPQRFACQLDLLLGRGYRPATFTTLTGAPHDAGLFSVTFDDAFLSVYELALPILRERGIPATLFVPTRYIGEGRAIAWEGMEDWDDVRWLTELRPMSWDQVRELAGQGWEIGSHTCSHPHLTRLDDAALDDELRASRAECERQLGAPCTSIAYPYGDVDARVAAATERAGYSAAGALPGSFADRDRYQWPRIGIYQVDDDRRFRLKTSPVIERLRAHAWWDQLVPATRARLQLGPRA